MPIVIKAAQQPVLCCTQLITSSSPPFLHYSVSTKLTSPVSPENVFDRSLTGYPLAEKIYDWHDESHFDILNEVFSFDVAQLRVTPRAKNRG